MRNVLSDKKAIFIFMLPAALFFIVIIAASVTMSFSYSLLDWDGLGKRVFTGFDNYVSLFTNPNLHFVDAVRHSIIFLVLSVFVQLPVSLIIALVLAGGVKFENFFRTVYFSPVIISTVIIGQLWMKIYHPQYGLLNLLLRNIGLDNLTRSWLGDFDVVLISTFIPILWQYVGYHMLLMYAAIKSISPDICDAAKIDGASKFQTSIRITIPLIVPMLKVSITFSVLGALKAFDLVYVLTNGGPAHASEMPTTLMVKTFFATYRYGLGSAMAVFIIAECLLCTLLINFVFKRIGANDL